MSSLREKKLNLLFVHNYYLLHGGEDQCYEEEIELLESHGHRVVRYTRHNSDIEKLGKIGMFTNIFWSSESYKDIEYLINKHAIDLIHVHNFFPLISPAVFWCAQKNDVPVVHTLHNFRLVCANGLLLRDSKKCEECLTSKFALKGVLSKCYRNSFVASSAVTMGMRFHSFSKTWATKVSRFIAPSHFVKQKIAMSGIDEDQISVRPNVVADHSNEVDSSLSRNGAIYIGRLSEEKGLEWFIGFWKKHFASTRLCIIGQGPLEQRLKQLAVGSKITFLGQQDRKNCVKELVRAKFLIMPSVCYETFGRTVVEAYSVGTPVLVPKGGAIEELVEHSYLGERYDLDDLAELVNIVQIMLDKNVSVKQIREFYEMKFSKEKSYENTMEIYTPLLK